MVTATMVPLEEYLHTSYEHDREWVDGQIKERGMPDGYHSYFQGWFLMFFTRSLLGLRGLSEVRDHRRQTNDSYGFNWLLKIPLEFQQPFRVTHESMRALTLSHDQPVHERAANLRRAFSGIVAGNIKEYGINAIERYGPFELSGERAIMEPLDQLLRSFVAQRRMTLTGTDYTPCYRLVA